MWVDTILSFQAQLGFQEDPFHLRYCRRVMSMLYSHSCSHSSTVVTEQQLDSSGNWLEPSYTVTQIHSAQNLAFEEFLLIKRHSNVQLGHHPVLWMPLFRASLESRYLFWAAIIQKGMAMEFLQLSSTLCGSARGTALFLDWKIDYLVYCHCLSVVPFLCRWLVLKVKAR